MIRDVPGACPPALAISSRRLAGIFARFFAPLLAPPILPPLLPPNAPFLPFAFLCSRVSAQIPMPFVLQTSTHFRISDLAGALLVKQWKYHDAVCRDLLSDQGCRTPLRQTARQFHAHSEENDRKYLQHADILQELRIRCHDGKRHDALPASASLCTVFG